MAIIVVRGMGGNAYQFVSVFGVGWVRKKCGGVKMCRSLGTHNLVTRIASRRRIERLIGSNGTVFCVNFSPATSDLRINRFVTLALVGELRRTNGGPVTLVNKNANVVNSPDNEASVHRVLAGRAVGRGYSYFGGRVSGFVSFSSKGTLVMGGTS